MVRELANNILNIMIENSEIREIIRKQHTTTQRGEH